MNKDVILVITTTSTREEAERIGASLVEEKLAACVQIDSPITSIYSWKNKIEKDTEHRLLIKTLKSNYERTESKIKDLHSYTTPQILAIPASNIDTNYNNWIASSVN
jgi:periplasmic divalent cation tolerance protein